MLVSVRPANDGKHKYIAIFRNGKQVKFGAQGYEDYTIHRDPVRKANYIKRHASDLRTRDPYRPGFLSMYLLWNKPTLAESIVDYNKRFF